MSFGKTGSIVERYITRNSDPAKTLAIYYLIDFGLPRNNQIFARSIFQVNVPGMSQVHFSRPSSLVLFVNICCHHVKAPMHFRFPTYVRESRRRFIEIGTVTERRIR